MGEHKHNPTAIAAREGKLPPKKKPISKREREHLVCVELHKRLGVAAVVSSAPPKGVSEEALPVADEATERSVAVEKTEDQRKPEGFIGHRKLEVSG